MQHGYADHPDPEVPGPPRARQVLGLAVIILGAMVLLDVLPFGASTFGIALVLVGAGLVV